ncbi:hypothetical protein [Chimaeribacter arupi]|uniref:hypothetical protein n=1 Tax=Chimaeribacter arupi TaxID=2060066 RepID=UPI000C7C45ED|nr:hypothetical protein [Chimaeribacter arupi]PLR29512.1 hypothetical protein CYR23_20235 [Chimaeribacter arupi]
MSEKRTISDETKRVTLISYAFFSSAVSGTRRHDKKIRGKTRRDEALIHRLPAFPADDFLRFFTFISAPGAGRP